MMMMMMMNKQQVSKETRQKDVSICSVAKTIHRPQITYKTGSQRDGIKYGTKWNSGMRYN